MVTAKVLAVSNVADGQLVVVAELKEKVDRRVTAAHHRLLVPNHPVFTRRICRGGKETEGGGEVGLDRERNECDGGNMCQTGGGRV